MSEKRRFESEDEERDYWAEQDSTEHVDWSRAERVSLPNLKPSQKAISLRLPQAMLEQLRILANKKGVARKCERVRARGGALEPHRQGH